MTRAIQRKEDRLVNGDYIDKERIVPVYNTWNDCNTHNGDNGNNVYTVHNKDNACNIL